MIKENNQQNIGLHNNDSNQIGKESAQSTTSIMSNSDTNVNTKDSGQNTTSMMSSTHIFKPILGQWQISQNDSNHMVGHIEIKTFPIIGLTLLHVIRRLSLGLSCSYSVSGFKFIVINHGKEIEPAHEFESIAGIVEDVPYIHYNIKGVIIKVTKLEESGDNLEYFILNIKWKIPGPVYASSIDVESFNKNNKKIHVEIINKDHVICNLDLNTQLNGEILVRYGFGYASEEDQEKYFQRYFPTSTMDKWHFLSAQFSNGVLSLNGEVTEVTSGSVPYDSLHLKVVTDGRITPKEVVTNAFKLLSEQIPYDFYPYINQGNNMQQDVTYNGHDGKQLLRNLDFMEAVVNLFEKHNIYTLGDLLKHSERSLKIIKGFGITKLQHVKEVLSFLNLSLPLQDLEKKK